MSEKDSASADHVIKPCPFCGGAVELEHRMGSMGSWGYEYDFAEIECRQCRIKLVEDTEAWERGKGTFCIRKDAEEKLLKRWNTRHDVREETAVEGESSVCAPITKPASTTKVW